MANMKTVMEKATAALRSAPFARGYNEAHKGLALADNVFEHDLQARWNYERGRLFAACFKGPLKFKKRIHMQALYAFANAVNCGSII
jgi:hypothetical protein